MAKMTGKRLEMELDRIRNMINLVKRTPNADADKTEELVKGYEDRFMALMEINDPSIVYNQFPEEDQGI